MLPLSATAEYGIAPGSAALVTAGQPLLVRVAPGWDAEVSYEVADGSYVTVWDVAQTAPDGSLWYPVDGGFVPVDGITSTATLEGAAAPEASLELYQTAPAEGVAFFQEAAPADAGWVDPNTGEWGDCGASRNRMDRSQYRRVGDGGDRRRSSGRLGRSQYWRMGYGGPAGWLGRPEHR